MASGTYTTFHTALLQGDITGGIDGADIKAVMVETGAGHYVVDLAADQYLSTIVAGDRIATSGNLASKTFTAGVFDAADASIAAVTGDEVGAVVVYVDTGNAATSQLIAYLELASPYVPDTSDVVLKFHASGIVALASA